MKDATTFRLRWRMMFVILTGVLLMAGTFSSVAAEKNVAIESAPSVDPPVVTLAKHTDDLPAIRRRRLVRVLVSYSNTNYFVSAGKQYGLEYELMQKFEKYLNKGVTSPNRQIHMVFIAVPFAELLARLNAGEGDVVAAGLTATSKRQEHVAFSRAYLSGVQEIVVAAPNAPALSKLSDLSGKPVRVVKGSSYVTHLNAFNQQLAKPIDIVEADEHLESEDLLEMVNAGIYPYTVVDEHIASLWGQVLTKLKIYNDIAVNDGSEIAWAVRKNNPKLKEALDKFVGQHKKGTLLGNILFKRYYENTRWVTNPVTAERRKQLDSYEGLFKKYAQKYNFDWLFLAALAYQESGLDPKKKSPAGAVGIMQIKPSTARDKNVGIDNVSANIENNIHAGTKYLAFIRDRYFSGPDISDNDRLFFSIAAYNAGPAKIRKMRNRAPNFAVDPNRWFYHVEHVARKNIGTETVQYVANISKYYLAYKSVQAALTGREKALKN